MTASTPNHLSPETGPFLTPLAQQMAVDLVVNDQGQAWILHDKPLTSLLEWAEFDADQGKISLFFQDGIMQEVGLKINEKTADCLKKCQTIFVGYMKDGKRIFDFGILPLTIHDSAWD